MYISDPFALIELDVNECKTDATVSFVLKLDTPAYSGVGRHFLDVLQHHHD